MRRRQSGYPLLQYVQQRELRPNRHRTGWIRYAAIAGTLTLVAATEGTTIPWPKGDAPSTAEIDDQLADAFELFDREKAEEYLEAIEKGEQSEETRLFQEDIDARVWDLDDLFRVGDATFVHAFRAADGFGSSPSARLSRVHNAGLGGPDTFACADCHGVGGPDGAGATSQNAYFRGDGDRPTTALVRNAPHTLGLGFVQALAREMSAELGAQRDAAALQAAESGSPVTVPLSSKGVEFGEVTVAPDGMITTDAIVGVDADLVVRPFGWRGEFETLRRIIEDAARVHFGIQSHVLTIEHEADPNPEELGSGPDWYDPDADGVVRELEEGTLTATAVYLSMLEAPVILPPNDPQLRDRWANGSALFESVGCNDCHRRELVLLSPFWDEAPDTTDGEPVRISLLQDGEFPKARPRVALFSDLKRHDMGPDFAEAVPIRGIGPTVFLTRPLWGLAETAPYMHDGRAATIPEAIEAHGGDADDAVQAWSLLSEAEQADLHVFLLSLSREPKVRVQG